MISARFLTRSLLATLVAFTMTACGSSPGVGMDNSVGPMTTGSSFGASDAQVGADTNIMEINSSGDLNSLSDADLESLDTSANNAARPVSSTDPTVQSLFNWGGSSTTAANAASSAGSTITKVGIVRSNSNGQFFLQINKGFLFWKTETSLPLSAPDNNVGLKIANDLNCKVILRGASQGSSCSVKLIFKVPDFSVIWGLFTRGDISGQAYDAATMAGIPDAAVTITSSNGRIWRAVTGTDGSYSVGQLDPGIYNVDVTAPDYTAGVTNKITVSKMHTSTVDLGLHSLGAQPTVVSQQPSQSSTLTALPSN